LWAVPPSSCCSILHLQQLSYTTDRLIGVLEQLASFYAGHKVVLLWDALSAHRSIRMRAWLDSQHDWLTMERLPAYAPELNPVEGLWANLKDLELANLPATTLAAVADATEQGYPAHLQERQPGSRVPCSHRPHADP
jgi:hypothetical protein